MEAVEEVVVVPPLPTMDQNKELSSGIAKGKRTKRHRPLSPIPFTITPPPFILEDNINNSHRHSSPSTPVSATSSVESTTTEEEDTARCLILLARGHFSTNKEDPLENINTKSTTTIGNKKAALGGGGAACVYACKTCNRAFSSFQALGGHRASHKKPKNEKKSSSTSLFMSDEEDLPSPSISISSKNRRMSLSLQLNNISTTPTTATATAAVKSTPSPRIHECSYCGAEFTSGQALGGHMRRHRSGPASPLSKPPVISIIESKEIKLEHQRIETKNGLSLDLNLPAPPAEDDQHHRFSFGSKQIHFV